MGGMMMMQLSEAARVLDARCRDDDVMFRGVSTDSRQLQAGNLFVALQGPNFDGHDYLGMAREQGAVAAAVSRKVDCGMPLLEVGDTRLALGRLAGHWRSQFDLPVIAITGSNGKTTVRSMVQAILECAGQTLSTRGNLNNDIGVPLTLFRLAADDRYAVIEMGANHPGEIDYLAGITRPTIAVVTNAGPAHLEGFGDLDGVARAKGELFARLDSSATAVINADDRYAGLWRELAGDSRVLDFGLEQEAAVTADWKGDPTGSDVCLMTPAGELAVRLPLPGRHNVLNALAAVAAALAAGIGLDSIGRGLESLAPVNGRFNIHTLPGDVTVIDDTYNANPESLAVALDVLAMADGEKWLVLGDMGELGPRAAEMHREAGRRAREAGVDRLFTLGKLAGEAVSGFGGGIAAQTHDELLQALRNGLHDRVNILVKGSRLMRMEQVVESLGAAVRGSSGNAEVRH
jgi:UDP-N-acetylmuramoyl-tripeptide--D-alanyl-D-alanine ligase